MRNLSRPRIKYITISAILLSFALLSKSIYVIGIVNLLSFILLGHAIIKIQNRLFSPFLLIGFSLYIFHSGHLWLSLFNIDPYGFLLSFKSYMTSSIDEIRNVYSFVTTVLIIYMATGILFLKKTPERPIYNIEYKPSMILKKIVIFLYSVIMFFELIRARSVSTLGYGEGYHYSNDSILTLSIFLDLLLILFLFLYRNSPKEFNIFLGLVIFKALFVMLFVGNRGSSVINLLVSLFIVAQYSYLSKNKAKLKKIIIASCLCLIIILPFISLTRGGKSSLKIDSFIQQQNPLEEFLTEFGGTVCNVFLVENYTGYEGFSNGLQLVATSLAVFPASNIIFGQTISNHISIANKLNIYFQREGLGGSMISQLYFNFGNSYLLYFSIFLIAIICAGISNKLLQSNNSIYSILILLCLFSGFMTFVRGEWYDVVIKFKIGCYLLFVIYIFKNYLFKNDSNNHSCTTLCKKVLP